MDRDGDPITPTDGRARRKSRKKEIKRLPRTTWFGTCVITILTALQELPTPAKLALIRDLTRFLERDGAEIERHERSRAARRNNRGAS
jgi:hypothetical protein